MVLGCDLFLLFPMFNSSYFALQTSNLIYYILKSVDFYYFFLDTFTRPYTCTMAEVHFYLFYLTY